MLRLSPPRPPKPLLAALGIAALAACAHAAEPAKAEAPPSAAAAQETIWRLEQAIYAGRGRGDLQPYIDVASPDYLGWPPVPAPMDKAALKASAPALVGSKERLTMTFVRMTLSGDTALIYYRTHLTVAQSGEPADVRYEVGHVWTWRSGRWLLLGGMARRVLAPPT